MEAVDVGGGLAVGARPAFGRLIAIPFTVGSSESSALRLIVFVAREALEAAFDVFAVDFVVFVSVERGKPFTCLAGLEAKDAAVFLGGIVSITGKAT